MKHLKRALFLALAAAMLLTVMAGCGSSGTPATQAPATQAPATQAPATQAPATQAPATETPEEPAGMYPISDETLTFTGFIAVGTFVSSLLEDGDFNTIVGINAANEACNVELEVSYVDNFFYNDQFQILTAAGDLPDFLDSAENYYSGGIEALIDDEICIDVVPYLEQYCPDYYEIFSTDSVFRNATISDEGHATTVWGRYEATNGGALIRQDWLDDLKLDTPTTYDELHDVLTAFKNEKGATNPFLICNGFQVLSAGGNSRSWFIGGYGLTCSAQNNDLAWIVEDGVVKCTYYDARLKDYVTMLRDWMAEGLISEDNFSINNVAPDKNAHLAAGESGFWIDGSNSLTGSLNAVVPDPNFHPVAMADVTLTKGETIRTGDSRGLLGNGGWSITTACKNPEQLLQYINWAFTEEGRFITNYGLEGQAHTKDAAGNISYTELITANPDGNPSAAMFCLYCTFWSIPMDRVLFTWTGMLPEENRNCIDIWTSNRTNENQYFGTMTAEEASTYNSLVGDIVTYCQENISKMIHGDADIDSTWDAMMNELESTLKIDQVVAIKQAAYNRYIAR